MAGRYGSWWPLAAIAAILFHATKTLLHYAIRLKIYQRGRWGAARGCWRAASNSTGAARVFSGPEQHCRYKTNKTQNLAEP